MANTNTYKYIYNGVIAKLHDETVMLCGLMCKTQTFGVLSHIKTINLL